MYTFESVQQTKKYLINVNRSKKITSLEILSIIILMQITPPWKLELTDSQIENAKGFQEGRVDKFSKEDEIFFKSARTKIFRKQK